MAPPPVRVTGCDVLAAQYGGEPVPRRLDDAPLRRLIAQVPSIALVDLMTAFPAGATIGPCCTRGPML